MEYFLKFPESLILGSGEAIDIAVKAFSRNHRETLRIIRLDDIIKMESYINENIEFDINSIGNIEVV